MKTYKSCLLILLCFMVFSLHPSAVQAQVTVGIGVRVRVVPPLLPVYEQPLCPGDGYLWVPGYWAWNGDEYYWVPGEWILPPEFGLLWTPCYWGFTDGFYVFHRGYWGRTVGYYGGVNYGYGYFGRGFYGGRWRGDHFEYNTAVMNVNRNRVHNVYHDPAVNRFRSNQRASFNGPGGVRSKPNEQERLAMRERHIPPTSLQNNHQREFSKDRNQFSTVNKGHPAKTVMNPSGERGVRQPSAVQNPQNRHEGVNRNVNQGNRPAKMEGNRPVNRPGNMENNRSNNQRPVRTEMNRQQNHSPNPGMERPARQHEQSAPRQFQEQRQQAPQQHQQREQMSPRQMPQQHQQMAPRQQMPHQQAPQQQRGNNREHER